jgi:WD40 repeat protein
MNLAIACGRTIAILNSDDPTQRVLLIGHTDDVNSVNYSSDGSCLVSTSQDHTVRLWDSDGNTLGVLRSYESYTNAAVFSPNDSELLTCSSDSTIQLYDTRTRSRLSIVRDFGSSVFVGAFSPVHGVFATGGTRYKIRLWKNSKLLREFIGHTGTIMGLEFISEHELASCSKDGTVKLWSVSMGNCLRTMDANAGVVSSMAVSGDGSVIVSAHDDGRVRLWNLMGDLVRVLSGHEKSVCCVRLHREYVITGSLDESVRIWNMITGELVQTIPTPGPVWTFAVSPVLE